MQRQSATIHVAPYPTKKVAFLTDYPFSWHDDVQEKRVQRMGKRIYGIRSFAYRIPHPYAAAASRLRLPHIIMEYYSLIQKPWIEDRFRNVIRQ